MNQAKDRTTGTLLQVIRYLTCALIIKVTLAIVWNYRSYLPPDFSSDFLNGRESYFFGIYQYLFYTHLIAGPCSLVLGMLLLNNGFRMRWPQWHRIPGRIQAVNVLVLIVPSGLGMAFRSDGGAIAATGFAALALATGFCCAQGWRSAVQRRFPPHRLWLLRCFVLLSSAVVLRVIAGSSLVPGQDGEWIHPTSAWACWLCPLLLLELTEHLRQGGSIRTHQPSPRHQS